MNCIVCGNSHFFSLPDPHPKQSLRSDCRIISEPLNKIQCKTCGLIIKKHSAEVAYASNYNLYGQLHGAEEFDIKRKQALAESLVSYLGKEKPANILEVGCGSGVIGLEIKRFFPKTKWVGIEPADSGITAAKENNLEVFKGIVGENKFPELQGKFDLVYSIQVIEHTEDPAKFISAMAEFLAPGGTLIIRCPDGAKPHSELLYSDHNFSFSAHHLIKLAANTGFSTVKYGPCSAGMGKEHGQVVALKKITEDISLKINPVIPDASIYLKIWQNLETNLLKQTQPYKKLYCFGAAQWAAQIACYAPKIWEKVEFCVIDGGKNQDFMGKTVLDYPQMLADKPEAVLVAINPATQELIKKRLEKEGLAAIIFSNLVSI